MVMTSPAERNYAFHRAELQRVFMQKLRPRQVQLRKRLESYTQPEDGSGPVELRFQDGTTATCDYLFGCDGVRSRVRAEMYTQLAERAGAAGRAEEAAELRAMVPPLFSGAVVHRCLIRKESLPVDALANPAFNHAGIILVSERRTIATIESNRTDCLRPMTVWWEEQS